MYLAKFRAPEGAIAQGMVRLPGLPRLPEGLRSRWWQSYTQLVGNIHAVGEAGASMRAVLDPGVSLSRALFACASETRVTRLRRFLAPFTRLETLVAGSAALPLSPQEYDAVADDVPAVRCRATMPGFHAGGAWLACDFRVAPVLDALMAEAEAYGYRLGYQVNVRPVTVNREVVRAARMNALHVRDLAGAPKPLVTLQQRLTDRLIHTTAVCEEYLAVDAGPAVEWLHEALRRHFRHQFAALRFGIPSWEFAEWAYEDELASAACTASEIGPDELCGCAIDDGQVTRLLAWRPPDGLADRFAPAYAPDAIEVPEPSAWPADLPVAYDGGGPYLFVSYKRADLDRVVPVMRHAQDQGWGLWYDRGIPGGADWHAMLEERLMSCSGLLLFLSQAAVESKYVRREVRFADSLDKPIVTVQLEAARLGHGMGLLLTHYQMLSSGARDFCEQLTRALTRIN
ncbi:MAG: toll/interleukin-1 receptor domain-containing protein [Egibacteraceae bacterium]